MSKYNYLDVVCRLLNRDEMLIPCQSDFPLVIEPKKEKSLRFIKNFLNAHSQEIMTDLTKFGAILFRGFDIKTSSDFQSAVLALKEIHPFSDRFMSTEGRELADGTEYVFNTSSIVKTGGTYYLGLFHNESFYLPDPARYISFFCINPAKLGGETGLIQMRGVYEQLDKNLKTNIEKNALFVRKWPIISLEQRYQHSSSKIIQSCLEHGLEVTDDKYITMCKPLVLRNLDTNHKALVSNLSFELPKLDAMLVKMFSPHYKGPEWTLHKTIWNIPGFLQLYNYFSTDLPFIFLDIKKNPNHIVQYLKDNFIKKNKMKENIIVPRLNNFFGDVDIESLAYFMRVNYISSLWKQGDILLIDNTQVAHAGMPGYWGKKNQRIIRTMVCNPLKLDYRSTAPGLQDIQKLSEMTLGNKLNG